ncbi:MAG: SDR family NAD(P)-dependent oxidoreductase [Chloroflexi bacterium]|nr:MAG: SDR family NAD(P)-dependent oxidoreductase [Chloroflexota bacterium]
MTEINSNSVFVVSGGAKGITARCVEYMANIFHCKFILMGRSRLENDPDWAVDAVDEAALKKAAMAYLKDQGEKPTPVAVQKLANRVLSSREIRQTLATVAANGGQAVYVSADITDADAVKSAIAEGVAQLGEVTGIIHGAGNLADKLIENKTEQDFETVYAAKVQGLENLLQAVPKVHHLVLFSSVAGFFGNVGQADYALANEILNKAAHIYKRQNPAAHVISINWGPWDAGMVTPQLKAYFQQHNIKVIPVNVGAHMLVEELLRVPGDDAVQIVIGSGLGTLAVEPDGELRTHRLRRRLVLEQSPFLQDHVVDGKAVLPMVSAMSWMSSTAEGLYPGFKTFGFEDYRVLKGIVFDDELADSYILELKETAKAADEITLEAKVSSHPPSSKLPRFHYSTRLFLVRSKPQAPIFNDFDLTPREDIPGSRFYDDYTLFHGFAFKGVERVLNISRERVTLECRCPVVEPRYQGQFPMLSFNYFATDIGLQSMGIYAKYYYGAGSLPLRSGGGHHYIDVPMGARFYVTLLIHKASETGLVTTLYLHDENGLLYQKVTESEITISKNLNELFKRNKLPKPLGS